VQIRKVRIYASHSISEMAACAESLDRAWLAGVASCAHRLRPVRRAWTDSEPLHKSLGKVTRRRRVYQDWLGKGQTQGADASLHARVTQGVHVTSNADGAGLTSQAPAPRDRWPRCPPLSRTAPRAHKLPAWQVSLKERAHLHTVRDYQNGRASDCIAPRADNARPPADPQRSPRRPQPQAPFRC
jgi:hypothetical protein